ncbi:hypothetical protein SANTM175S_10632 [Streptomyces antimycoticus]
MGGGEGGGAPGRDELVDGVEGEVLDAGGGVEGLDDECFRDLFGGAGGAGVAVVHGVGQEGAVGGQEAVVDGPGVDADAGQGVGGVSRRCLQAVQDALVEGQDVPVQGAQDAGGPVGEAVCLVEGQPFGGDLTDDDAAAGRTEVYGGEAVLFGGHVDLVVGGVRGRLLWCVRGPSRACQRRNAAATPASTGMCRPVVWVRSPPTSVKTAFATWVGSTSRFRRVRRA